MGMHIRKGTQVERTLPSPSLSLTKASLVWGSKAVR
jgi:hypothetical protein